MTRLFGLALLTLSLGGCIVSESTPSPTFAVSVDVSDSSALCAEQRWDRGVACVLSCGSGDSAQAAERPLLRFAGAGARYAPDDRGDFFGECGTASWSLCRENRTGGLACADQERRYCVRCTAPGVALVDADGSSQGRPMIPAEAIRESALPSMLQGELRAEPGTCLSACLAALTREPCGGCGDGEACLDTGMGKVCHPKGTRAKGEPCRGHEDCRSLRCDETGATCE